MLTTEWIIEQFGAFDDVMLCSTKKAINKKATQSILN